MPDSIFAQNNEKWALDDIAVDEVFVAHDLLNGLEFGSLTLDLILEAVLLMVPFGGRFVEITGILI